MSSVKDKVPKYLHTERLVLEFFDRNKPEHYDCIFGCLNNPTAHAKIGDLGITTPAQFDAANAGTRLKGGAYSNGAALDFYFCYLLHAGDQNGPLVGVVSLGQRSASVPPDLGWALTEASMGKGYATEAAREFLRFLREDFGLQEIMVWPGSTNKQSCRVAEKLGFVPGGSISSADKPGQVDVSYILPGMEVKDHTLSLFGDKGADTHA